MDISKTPPPLPWIGHNSARSRFTDAANDNLAEDGVGQSVRVKPTPATISRPLFNGYNPSGRAEDFRVVSWTEWNVSTRGLQHHVGFLFERWPSGSQTRMNATPEVVLWKHDTFATREEADTACASLARDNVFSMIKEKVMGKADKNSLCSRPEHLPFSRPTHWRTPRAMGPHAFQTVK